MERDILKKVDRDLRWTPDIEIPLHRRSPCRLSGEGHVPCARGLAGRLLRLAFTSGKLKIGCQSRVAGEHQAGSSRQPWPLWQPAHSRRARERKGMAQAAAGSNDRCATMAFGPSWSSPGAAAPPIAGHGFPIAPNLLDRKFSAAARNQIWLADITYIETGQGWLYLAAVIDLYSRRIVGWAMADHLRAELPLAALRMAIKRQRPGAVLIHHSDRGVQYASAEYRQILQAAGFRAYDEPQGRLLRQRPDGKLLPHAENRTRPSPAV